MKVSLGQQTLMSFLSAPKKFKILGMVRMGMEFGILAINENGQYVRVNGSYEQNLCKAEVESAIQSAVTHGHFKLDRPSTSHNVTIAPIVTIKKHRHASLPLKNIFNSTISISA